MAFPIRLIPRKLAHRLILFIVAAFLAMGAVSGYLYVKTQEEQLLETIITGADQLSNGISSATWHAMLADNRGSAYEIMHTIATRQGIDRIRIFNREGRIMYSSMDADSGTVPQTSETCMICHSSAEPLPIVDPRSRSRIFRAPDGHRQLAMVTPIYNEPACSNADCHAHPARVNVLGVLDVTYSLNYVDRVIEDVQQRVFWITILASVIAGAFLAVLVRSAVHSPITKLIEGTRAVSAMQLDRPLEIKTEGELGELASSFELMRQRLQKAVQELNELTAHLEQKVQERTDQLDAIHEKLSQSDRLASLGQLAASVAHEINNPIAGVLNLASLLQRIVTADGIPPDRIEEVRKYFGQIATETSRVGRIVTDLLAFSRRSSPQQSLADWNAIIRRTLSILDHKLELMGVVLELHLDPNLPAVKCDASQMQQVIVNLVMNAAEATLTRGLGHVIVRTGRPASASMAMLEVTDNGDGIPTENLRKIFDPFFTTKGEGKGTGLGLAVVYGIVVAHGGDVTVESTVGVGSTFRVSLPIEAAVSH